MAAKYVYDFHEGNREMKDLLGGKGANLAEMTRMGLPVPHGFTVTCEACNAYRAAGRRFPGGMLEEALEHAREAKGVRNDVELDEGDLRGLVVEFKAIIAAETGREFPQDPTEQLTGGVEAVFGSWDNKRAVDYRRKNKIDDSLGTAVNLRAMVFGNKGDDSGTGVAFTRNPANGDPHPYGDYLVNAQGEDVVSGIRNTMKL